MDPYTKNDPFCFQQHYITCVNVQQEYKEGFNYSVNQEHLSREVLELNYH